MSGRLVVGVWLTARCPVRDEERVWIERSLGWLAEQFGEEVLFGPVLLPTDEYLPGRYSGSRDDVAGLLDRLRAHMALDAERVALEFVDDDCEDDDGEQEPPAYQGATGEYRRCGGRGGGRGVVAVRGSQARDPMALVATIAHELGHERLLGEERIAPDRPDHEPLTDLLTVFFGLGIFTANAARGCRGRAGGRRATRLGYLTGPMFGYALAYYAWLRRDPAPRWSRYLDPGPRACLARGLRYLRRR